MATTLFSAPILNMDTQMAPDLNLDNLKTDLKMNLAPAGPEAPKMKAKKAAKVKTPKPKKHVEKKMKTLKTKIPKVGKVHKEKHHAHHPPWADMMVAAVGALKERDGSSSSAIKKYILSNYQIDTEPDKITPMLRRGLKAAIATNKLRQFKGKGLAGSFKLPIHHGVKTDVGKKLKKNLKGKKIVKKAPKTGGKKILKKGMKQSKKSTGGKKVKKVKKITPVVEGTQLVTSTPMKLGKIKMVKKPKSESKKELGMKKKIIKKTPLKGKTGKAMKMKASKVPKPKINPVATFTAQLNPPIITIN